MTRMRIIGAAILTLALIALGLSLWLTRHAQVAGPIAGCIDSAVFACDDVLGSRWSSWLGIPVALFGVINYSLLTGAAVWLLVRSDNNRGARMLLVPTAVAAASAGLWFTGLQLFALNKICPYCMVTHGCGLMIASLVIAHQWLEARASGRLAASDLQSSLGIAAIVPPTPQGRRKPLSHLGLVGVGLAAFACLVVGQLAYRPQRVLITQMDAAMEPIAPPEEAIPELASQGDAAQDDISLADAAPPQLVAGHDDLSITTEPSALVDLGQPSIDDLTVGPVGIASEQNMLSTDTGTSGGDSMPRQSPAAAASSHGPIVAIKGELPLQRADVILLGNSDAEFVMVEVLDYTCITCRQTHQRIDAARREFGDRLAVALLPIAMERSCNPALNHDMAAHRNACKLARLSLAVWEVAPDRFEELHEWLMQSDSFQNRSAAWEFASGLVDTDQLVTTVFSSRVEERLARNIRYWELFGKRLPTLLIRRTIVQGGVESDAQLIELIRSQMSAMQSEAPGLIPAGASPST